MKQFLSFVRKEFYHIWRDKETLLILLGMPVVLILIFGFALTNEVKNSKFAVLDFAKDDASNSITREIEASKYFQQVAELKSYDDIEKIFRKGNTKVVIVYPPSFSSDLQHFNKASIQVIADASDPNIANTLTDYATTIIKDYQQRLVDEKKYPYTIQTRVRMLYNPQLKGTYSFVPGVMSMILMLVCTMMTAITVVREKETGTMEVLLVSPISPVTIILAKAVPYLIVSLINVVTILLMAVFILEMPIHGSILLLMAESILYIMTCLAFGLMISTVTATQQLAMFVSLVGLFLPTIMLSGFLFPIENMPFRLQKVSNLVPAKWYYLIVKSIMVKGLGFGSILKETLVLVAMTIFLLSFSLMKFKIRLE